MYIQMYNVEFGDCFLICDEHENLLVDFGSDDAGCLDKTASNLEIACNDKDLSVLCTHFHNDHISGMLSTDFPFKRKINKLLLPDILGTDDHIQSFGPFEISVLSDIFDSIVLQKKPLYITLHEFINKLYELPNNLLSPVSFLSRGDTFSCGANNYNVLWPTKEGGCLDPRTLRSIKKLLLGLDLADAPEIDINESFFDLAEIPLSLGILDKYISKLLEAYRCLKDKDSLLYKRKELLDQLSVLYEQVCKEVEKKAFNLSSELCSEIKAKSEAFHNDANKYSVVFQSSSATTNPCILMTGDITRPTFRQVLSNSPFPSSSKTAVYSRYNIIKAPHHATKTHYYFSLPFCDVILASNGDTTKRNRGKIYHEYGLVTHDNPYRKALCSNCRCELIDKGSGHVCSHCTKVSHSVIKYP